MRGLPIAAGIAGLLLELVSSTGAHIGDRVYPIFELTDEDVALIDVKDGSIADWLDIVGEPTLTSLDFEGYKAGGGFVDPSDLDFRVWLAWHDATNRIFVAMERADDVYVNSFNRTARGPESNMGLWDGSILFDVDGDHSGGEFWPGVSDEEERWLLWHQQAQEYYAIAEVFDGLSHIDLAQRLLLYDPDQFFLLPPYAEGSGARFGEQPVITVTEFFVTSFDHLVWNRPEDSLVSELFPGKIIGLYIMITDVDERPIGDQAFFNLSPSSLIPSGNADRFGDAVLLGPGGGLPDDSVVESITWARIKAAFVK